METDKVKQNQEYAEQAFWTGHFHYMMQALAVAMTRTMVWRIVGDGTPYTMKEIFEFAKKEDEENELQEGYFYMVSREGAIGLSPGLEYLTQWIFVPMEPCKERDFLERRMREQLLEEEAMEQAVSQAVDKGIAKERSAKKYYIAHGKEKDGPYSIDDLMEQAIGADTLIWAQGMAGWVKARQVPELAMAIREQHEKEMRSTKFYLVRNNKKHGPYDVSQLLQLNLSPDTLVWSHGMAGWVKARQVPLLVEAMRTHKK